MNRSKTYQDLRLFSGNAHPALAKSIATHMGVSVGDALVTTFPDEETFVKINDNIRGADLFIVQPTCPPADHHLMELLIMIDAAKRASADRITAVLPFYGYARQDRKDQPRVPITAKLVANLLTAAGADRILTMDLHAQQIQGFFDIPVDHLHAAPVFYRYLKSKQLKDVVVVTPDVGGMKMAFAYSTALGGDLAIVAKRRISATETQALYVVGEVAGRNVVMVDDLTETGGTLASAAKVLKAAGAKQILACVSHAILNPQAAEKLRNAPIDEVITTNSTPQRDYPGLNLTVLSIAELLGEAITCIHTNESVSKLFDTQTQQQPLLPLKSHATAKSAAAPKSAPEPQKKTADKLAVTPTTEKRKSGERSYAKAN
jgi:ribose-phosphate pyrophosphokinase